jgi:hypothetical protein
MKDELEEYIQNWEAVQEVEKQELASTTFKLRWRQLNSLLGMAKVLGIMPQRDDQLEESVFIRWAYLKGARERI